MAEFQSINTGLLEHDKWPLWHSSAERCARVIHADGENRQFLDYCKSQAVWLLALLSLTFTFPIVCVLHSICVVWLTLLSCQKLELNQGKIMTHHISVFTHTHTRTYTYAHKHKKIFFSICDFRGPKLWKIEWVLHSVQTHSRLVYVHHYSVRHIFSSAAFCYCFSFISLPFNPTSNIFIITPWERPV